MTDSSLTTILTLVLGAGGIGFLKFLFDGINNWRAGSSKKKSDAMQDLERWRSDANDSREWAESKEQWWRDRAGQMQYALTSHGIAIPEPTSAFPVKPQPQFVEAGDG